CDGDGHFAALVRSLQIPGLPTATLWIDTTSVEGILTRDLLPLSDRLVLDTGRCGRPDELVTVARFAAASGGPGGGSRGERPARGCWPGGWPASWPGSRSASRAARTAGCSASRARARPETAARMA